MGSSKTSLTIFTVQMAMKYRLGSVISQLDQGHKIHNALLVSFIILIPPSQTIKFLSPSVVLHMNTRVSFSTRMKMMTRKMMISMKMKNHLAPLNQRNVRKKVFGRWVVSQTETISGLRWTRGLKKS